MTDIDSYNDPILSLVRDPNLNKDSTKSNQLINLIKNIQERKINKLCSTAFKILQHLENTRLKFKNWEFLSLDFNSDSHFDEGQDTNIKNFNTNVANNVINACNEINKNMTKITSDIDLISKNSKMLIARDLMSDEGAMLTSLLLRVIKIKNEVIDQLSISYAKAKLIMIGKELENDDLIDDFSIVEYYKSFIIALLKQLNKAINDCDFDSKFECLAVINDLEQMFEKFKIEKLLEQRTIEESHSQHYHETFSETSSNSSNNQDDSFSDYSITSSQYLPLVHSITGHSPASLTTTTTTTTQKDSSYDMTTSQMYKSSITEELPYLMTAFNSAKNFKDDVSHYKQEQKEEIKVKPKSITKPQQLKKIPEPKKPYFHKANLPNSSLYSDTHIIPSTPPPIYNNSLLRTFGIRPQVITIPSDDENKENQNNKKPLFLTEQTVSNLQHDFID
ncbi:unnamed protein product [Candida verbasci]|uniref:Uncharacterized protein n=1 Tax=Candida verbasci TaxID=1227364 RepID=A0A9W4TQS4_9ASCO|nr:unnamed protein product [Candida verbasci]